MKNETELTEKKQDTSEMVYSYDLPNGTVIYSIEVGVKLSYMEDILDLTHLPPTLIGSFMEYSPVN